MKTKRDFFNEFFSRLSDKGFFVKESTESDLAAEVYWNDALFCAITQDGDIVYEAYNADQARELEETAESTRQALNFCGAPPFENMDRLETVNLAKGVYFKVFESNTIVLICRFTALFGYEFTTCQKADTQHNRRPYYREVLCYNLTDAQDNFMQRSGLTASVIPDYPHGFSNEEMDLLLSCCTRCVLLDNDMDSITESRINGMVQKLESLLPPKTEIEPRHCFQEDRE
jgi:hypothetical protein